MGNYRGFNQQEREKGRAKAIENRNDKANARRAHVAMMCAEGKTKAGIARHFGVNWETINRDCKILESQTHNAFKVSGSTLARAQNMTRSNDFYCLGYIDSIFAPK